MPGLLMKFKVCHSDKYSVDGTADEAGGNPPSDWSDMSSVMCGRWNTEMDGRMDGWVGSRAIRLI